MKRFAIVKAGIVTNLALADAPLGETWVELSASQSPAKGDGYAAGVFTPDSPKPPRPTYATENLWRNAVWDKFFKMIAAAKRNELDPPLTFEALIKSLPFPDIR